MTNSLINIENISLVNLIQSEVDFLPIGEISFIENSFESGGFGKLHKVLSVNGKQISGLVVKLISDPNSADHALATISLLHKKISRKHSKQDIGIGQAYPQLIGMPFCCFTAFDEINQIKLTALLMYDLKDLGYDDFGSDSFNKLKFAEYDLESKLYYSYQLATVISLLHELEFIHSDLSENAIWINSKNENLLIIDYDSGYHFDSQEKPTTLGKVGHWIGSKFRRILSKEIEKQDLSHNDRLAEENWVLANAIFELIFGVSPYFYLIDAADGTKHKYLKNNVWPEIDPEDKLLNVANYQTYRTVIDYSNLLVNAGLAGLMNEFKKAFNKGFKVYQHRPSSDLWRKIFSEICKSLQTVPVVLDFKSNKKKVQSKDDFVEFKWSNKRTNYITLNDQVVFANVHSLTFVESTIVHLELVNDFGSSYSNIEIVANKIDPTIINFYADKTLRDSLNPILLEWEVADASRVEIIGVNSNLPVKSNIEVRPESQTLYRLIAYGNFNQTIESFVEVSVITPEISQFNYYINIEKGIDNIDLAWESKNAISAVISPMIGSVEPSGILSKNIPEKTVFTLTAKGHFGQASMSIEAKPFPIPIINSLFIPTPDFNLETNYFTSELNVNESFIDLSPISIDTSIKYTSVSPDFVNLDKNLNEAIADKPKINYFDNLFSWVNKSREQLKKNN
jgi:hypothetical protein